MTALIATYYSEELSEWAHPIEYNMEAIHRMIEKLAGMIRNDSTESLTNKIEMHQTLLKRMAARFAKLPDNMQHLAKSINSSRGILQDDKSLEAGAGQNQAILRIKMQAAEKEFVDIKYECYRFLAGLHKY